MPAKQRNPSLAGGPPFSSGTHTRKGKKEEKGKSKKRHMFLPVMPFRGASVRWTCVCVSGLFYPFIYSSLKCVCLCAASVAMTVGAGYSAVRTGMYCVVVVLVMSLSAVGVVDISKLICSSHK